MAYVTQPSPDKSAVRLPNGRTCQPVATMVGDAGEPRAQVVVDDYVTGRKSYVFCVQGDDGRYWPSWEISAAGQIALKPLDNDPAVQLSKVVVVDQSVPL